MIELLAFTLVIAGTTQSQEHLDVSTVSILSQDSIANLSSLSNKQRIFNQHSCRSWEFKCPDDTAECLSFDKFCNGLLDCELGGDEPEGCTRK